MSRPFGIFIITRALPHANDCNVRRNSPSYKKNSFFYNNLKQANIFLHKQTSIKELPLMSSKPKTSLSLNNNKTSA